MKHTEVISKKKKKEATLLRTSHDDKAKEKKKEEEHVNCLLSFLRLVTKNLHSPVPLFAAESP